jgi:hypothetical protein
MQPQADGNRDGRVSLPEWFERAAAVLEQERDKRVGPQTPQLIVPSALRELTLIGVN